MLHVHFGAGSLGLGLISFVSKLISGNTLVLVNRRSSESLERCELMKKDLFYSIAVAELAEDGSYQFDAIDIAIDDFFFTDEIAELEALFSKNEILVVTTSLKEDGLNALTPLLQSLLSIRPVRAFTFFIACENAVRTTDYFQKNFDASQNQNIFPLDCVVDRICNKPMIFEGRAGLLCEPYWQFIIQAPGQELAHRYIADAFQSDRVIFTKSIQPYVCRKKWLVNSVHLAFAMYAHFFRKTEIHGFAKEIVGSTLLTGLIRETMELFLRWNATDKFFSYDQILKYSLEVEGRIRSHPQIVLDSTTRFREETLVKFFEDYDRKIIDPYTSFGGTADDSIVVIPRNALVVAQLVARQRWISNSPMNLT